MKLKEVATKLNVSEACLYRILKDLNFNLTKNKSNRYVITEEEFESIKTEYGKFNYTSSCGIKFKDKSSYIGHIAVCKLCRKLDKPSEDKLDEFCNRYKNGESIYSLEKEMNIDRLNYYKQELNKRNIKLRDNSEAAKTEFTRTKYEKSCIDKYGCKNTFQSPKTKQTFLERYGVENPDHIPGIIQKIQMTKIKKYGNAWGSCRLKPGCSHSTIHDTVSNYLRSIGEEVIDECGSPFRIKTADERVKFAIPDITLPKYKLVIEIYGGYWHADPREYSRSDIISTYEGKMTAEQIWERDSARESFIKSFGYKFINIWEREILNGEYKEILNKCLKELKE